jgi:hypothetical protein
VDGWEVQRYNAIVPRPEGAELFSNGAVVQVSKLVFADALDLGQTGVLLQLIIIAQAIAIQYLVNQLAAITAKVFLPNNDALCKADGTAMVTY